MNTENTKGGCENPIRTFPAIALLDGAQDDYLMFSLFYMMLAAVLSIPAIGLCAMLSDACESIADNAIREREETAKALRNYLLNGGRA